MQWDFFEAPNVMEAQRKNRDAIHFELGGKIVSDRSRQNELTDLHLGDNFPQAGNADPDIRGW
jgi:hypothetical protein